MNYLHQLFNLEGKVAAVIGGGGHICSALAQGFAEAGCLVAVLDCRIEKAEAVVASLQQSGYEQTLAVPIDVTQKDSHEAALETLLQTFPRVDILVNGAGINGPTPFLDISASEWHAIMDSQITGTFFGCQVFGAAMLKNKSGTIINISSASASPPLSKAFTYSVAKAGILNLTQNLGREWAKQGVRVNALRPGFFPTDWNRQHFITPEREAQILNHTPMGRFGEPKELIGATLWLASAASAFVTGSEVAVDGGFSCMTI